MMRGSLENEPAANGIKSPSASIIILNFNYAEFLVACIQSALNQTCPAEVVVVDDGSTDKSREIIGGFGRRIIPVLKDNGGMHTAMNAGFAASHGDVVIFLDADDLLLPPLVERVLAAHRDRHVVKSHWSMHVINAEGQRVGRTCPQYRLGEGNLLEVVRRDGPNAYHASPTSGNSWSRDFLDRVMPITDARFQRHAEVYLVTLAPLFGRIARLDEPLGCYRQHGRNDYASAPLRERNERNLALYDARCDALAAAMSAEGHRFDRSRWEPGKNAFRWMTELETLLPRVTPVGSRFILVDENQWPDCVAGRQAVPFLERNGQYYGPPADSSEAVRELERMCRADAGFLVLAWPCFWWRETYADFINHLNENFKRVHESGCLVIFNLNEPAG